MVRYPVWIVLAAISTPSRSASQEPNPCRVLAQCALRVEAGNPFLRYFGPVDPSAVVGGQPPVQRYPFDPSDHLEAAFATNDSTAAYYANFVAADGQSDVLRSVSNLLLVTSVVGLVIRDDLNGWPVAVGWGSIALRLTSEIPGARARREFAQAAEIYNRQLAGP